MGAYISLPKLERIVAAQLLILSEELLDQEKLEEGIDPFPDLKVQRAKLESEAQILQQKIDDGHTARISLGTLLLAASLALSIWCGYCSRNHSSEDIENAIEYAAVGYSSFGVQYEQLQDLINYALEGNEESFFRMYDRRLSSVVMESKLSEIEMNYIEYIQKEILSEGSRNVAWSGLPFDGELAVELIDYTAKRCSYYEQLLPVLAFWVSSEPARSISSEFAGCLVAVLEADAAVAGELYHQSCAVHLDTAEGNWVQNVRALVAEHPDLELHRNWEIQDDRGSHLENLRAVLEKAERELEKERNQLELEMKYGT